MMVVMAGGSLAHAGANTGSSRGSPRLATAHPPASNSPGQLVRVVRSVVRHGCKGLFCCDWIQDRRRSSSWMCQVSGGDWVPQDLGVSEEARYLSTVTCALLHLQATLCRLSRNSASKFRPQHLVDKERVETRNQENSESDGKIPIVLFLFTSSLQLGLLFDPSKWGLPRMEGSQNAVPWRWKRLRSRMQGAV